MVGLLDRSEQLFNFFVLKSWAFFVQFLFVSEFGFRLTINFTRLALRYCLENSNAFSCVIVLSDIGLWKRWSDFRQETVLEQPHPQYLSTAAKSKGLGTRHYPAAKGGRVIAGSGIWSFIS